MRANFFLNITCKSQVIKSVQLIWQFFFNSWSTIVLSIHDFHVKTCSCLRFLNIHTRGQGTFLKQLVSKENLALQFVKKNQEFILSHFSHQMVYYTINLQLLSLNNIMVKYCIIMALTKLYSQILITHSSSNKLLSFVGNKNQGLQIQPTVCIWWTFVLFTLL